MTAGAYPAAEVDPIEVDDDGAEEYHFCGSGERDRLGERCPARLPYRGLCDTHKAQIYVAAARARVGDPAQCARFLKWAAELDPTLDVALSDADAARAAKPDDRLDYRAQISADARARRIALAERVAEYVAENGGPITAQALEVALDVSTAAALRDAIKLAHADGRIHYQTKNCPRKCVGVWESEAAFITSRDAA